MVWDDTKNAAYWQEIWDLDWGTVDVLVGGKSAVDLNQLQFRDVAEAQSFLRHYGYDMSVPDHARQVHAMFVEAIEFMRTQLIPDEWAAGLRPPDRLLDNTEIELLLVWASDRSSSVKQLQAWACATLRVMHTIAHLDYVLTDLGFQTARDQILNKFQRYIYHDADGQAFLGGKEMAVPIEGVTWKLRKARESIILKLLHKKDNVAETIYDLLGIRIITKQASDALLVVKFLRQLNMVNFANCNPSRSRNTLVNLPAVRESLPELHRSLVEKRLSPKAFQQKLQEVAISSETDTAELRNPHSSLDYRAIQMTCRQLVHFGDPLVDFEQKLLEAIAGQELPALEGEVAKSVLTLARRWLQHSGSLRNQVAMFFPYEVQIMDLAAYEESNQGRASHECYKYSQRQAVRSRVMGAVFASYAE